jgi:cysteine desulfurase
LSRLLNEIPDIQFNGLSADPDKSIYTIVNMSLPLSGKTEMLLFRLDLDHIAVSGGSACASGALAGSHVINALHSGPDRSVIRFSFSKFNTLEEVDFSVDTLKQLLDL